MTVIILNFGVEFVHEAVFTQGARLVREFVFGGEYLNWYAGAKDEFPML